MVATDEGNVTIGSISARGGNAEARDATLDADLPESGIDPATRVNGDGGNGGNISVCVPMATAWWAERARWWWEAAAPRWTPRAATGASPRWTSTA